MPYLRQWGAIVALRTGPREFMKWLVTAQAAGGAMPAGAPPVREAGA